ncbi:MAG: Transcription termination factor Rho [Candidatus Gottesmanbacteria bacterium GW2011_GWB1_43_11]|uniref:Transcription termination factor Rho n=1 Tax=Candidatus Gottesmanbacteria bacterium GW2011_GWB1_43_11 TaxID=1618446 RepID=A0A0G1FE37_9BACT|nr:MAG: Transcription termination factor Rho [Candidatus Gottesmanbacteria bacterium GW2011_GWA1_42_26]KKS85088.1 MAG: Transcription termination factor Rho [Candidatus Gottesmanbacteria bacterium GW2011_GWB1_43_11]OGG08704.1 MAG: transcription termination factor Rho [Candidatus Gottesmanbacteria bacterium RIFCSPHIGHO2_01_FULL_43_15]OGG28177.1 MAG: transcription termination factor Rho [Candidatus Gottesmanbacteria bacterium RIFCSPLOWO2_01_FULL_42_10]
MPTKSVKKIPVTATPATSIPEKPAPTDAPKSTLSVEDLVGGPVSEARENVATPPSEPKAAVTAAESAPPGPVRSPIPTMPMRPAPSQYQGAFNSPRPYQAMRPRFMSVPPASSSSTGTATYRPYRPYREFNANREMQDANVPTQTVKGFLEIMPEGHGFLRPKFIPSDHDIYISQSQIRKFMLRGGDEVVGQAREPKDNERYYGLLKVEKVNEVEADKMGTRPRYDDLVPIYPKEMIKLETEKLPLSTRIIDLLAPIGFGQRGMIVSPPKAGKTTILKEIANGISTNYPKVYLMAALIGERPEEVTDLSRSIKGEVIASHFDESPQEQTKVAEIALERAKRQVEMGKDVVILLDSITRLARAYNLTVNSSGRTLSGGFDPAALYPAKRFLGAARKCEGGGSLTIIGTALVETGSRMDDLIYEEFKGTGNMELHLSRALAEKRVFPAIDVEKSGTRQEQLLFSETNMKRIVTLRNMLSLLNNEAERTLALIERLTKTKSNEEFLKSLSKGG